MLITKKHAVAIRWITKILNDLKIDFVISGGFAANFYGSDRPLYDIDIDIRNHDFAKLCAVINTRYISWGPERFKDNSWDLIMITLIYNDILIDVCDSDSAMVFSKKDNQWVKYPELNIPRTKGVFNDLDLYFINKTSLLKYKSCLQRDVDMYDVQKIISKQP